MAKKLPPKAGTASARARAERDVRVDRIVGLMASGRWVSTKSTRDLAAQWGVSVHAVSEYAREASGIVRRIVQGDPESVKAAILAGIEAVGSMALKTTKVERVGKDEYEERPAPTLDAALRSYELRLKALGLMPDKLQVEITQAPASDEERLATLLELIAEAEAEVAKLKAKKKGSDLQ